MVARDYYEVLGVVRDADAKTIRTAYRELAFKYHPDMNPDNPTAEERFKEINEANSVLEDEVRRAEYDRFRRAQSFQSVVSQQSAEPKKGRSLASIVRARATKVKKEKVHTREVDEEERIKEIRKSTERLRTYYQSQTSREGASAQSYVKSQQEQVWKVPRNNEKLLSDLLQYKEVLQEKTKMAISSESLESCLISHLAEFRLHEPRGLLEELKQYLETQKISPQQIANIIFYTYRIKFDRPSQTAGELKIVAETLSTTQDLESMIFAASATRTVLESEQVTSINPNKYAEYFKSLFAAFLPHLHENDFTANVLKIITEASNYTIDCTYKTHEMTDVLINILTGKESLAITTLLLQKARRSTDFSQYSKAQSGYGDRIKALADARERLYSSKNYSPEDFLTLINVIYTIQTTSLTTKSKRDKEEFQTRMLRMNMPSIKEVAVTAEKLADYIPKHSLSEIADYVKALGKGARGYVNNNIRYPLEEWGRAINIGFESYKRNPTCFVSIMDAIDRLKLDEHKVRDRWPGIFYPTLEATAYAGARIMQYALSLENPSDALLAFYNFLDGYRTSSFRKTRKKNDEESTYGLSKKQVEAYKLLQSIPARNSHRKILKNDMERLIDIYLK